MTAKELTQLKKREAKLKFSLREIMLLLDPRVASRNAGRTTEDCIDDLRVLTVLSLLNHEATIREMNEKNGR